MTVSESVYETVPLQLKVFTNWVLWKYATRNGKKTKIPYQINGVEAMVNNPYTWTSFENVCKQFAKRDEYGGIGFVFSKNTGLVGIDFDHIKEKNTNEWNQNEIRDALSIGSYTEISPSEDGLHVICLGRKPGTMCKVGNHEMYDSVHYFTVTGNRFPGSNPLILGAQQVIDRLYTKWFSAKENSQPTKHEYIIRKPAHITTDLPTLSDDEIIRLCNNAKNSVKFKKLFSGDWCGYTSQSEADFALCRIIAFYSSDPAQVERIMQMSSLSREKWNRPGYLSKTVNNAIRLTGVMYGN